MKKNRTFLWMTTLVAFLSFAAIFTGCKKDDYVAPGGVGLCPLVVSTTPLSNATMVPLNSVITATFNEKMDPASFSGASFTIDGVLKASITGTVSYNVADSTMKFTPSSKLALATTYTCTVKAKVKDLHGNFMQTDYRWAFSTGPVIAPIVILTDPFNTATNVAPNKIITATFSLPMDATTINGTTFTVMAGTNAVAGTVTYNSTGSVATFTPAANLTPNTPYTGTITTGALNADGTPIQANYVWTFTTGAFPTVVSTDPANLAKNVFLNTDVDVVFSVPMDALTITAATFTIKQGATIIPGTITYSGKTANFKPTSPLVANTVYNGTITTGVKNVPGIPMQNDYVWTFTTGTFVAPTVISTNPANLAKGVPLNKTVTAVFSAVMNPGTINTTTYTLKQGATAIVGVVTYSGTTASFNPTADLTAGLVYTATITTVAANPAGTKLAADKVWTFTTATATEPLVISTVPMDNATNVAVNTSVTGTFNMNMDPLTITGSTFTLKQGATPVAGLVSYAGTTATFNPSSDLLPGTNYTATITTGAKNLTAFPLSQDYVWTFRTAGGGVVPPSIVLGSAADFGILAGVGVTNAAGPSVIHDMNVGIYPGVRSSVTGFPPATVVNGAIFASDDIAPPGVAAMLLQAKTDLTNAYLDAEGATSPAPATVSGDQGGKTLAPGIYKSTSTLLIQSGDLTLDGGGDPNATWIFQVASDFTTVGGAGGNVILTGGANAANIFWQVGSSATVGGYTTFYGNILALTTITMGSHATAVGSMLARNGAVTMTSTNTILKP